MKESVNYFSHDFGARNDPKLLSLQMDMGGQGLAIWWCLVEMLWENDGYLPVNYKAIAYSLHWARPEEVQRVVEGFGLFHTDGQRFWNESAVGRIERRREVSRIRSEAGRRGAEVTNNGRISANAEQMPSNCRGNSDGSAAARPSAINKYLNKEIQEINKDIRDIYPSYLPQSPEGRDRDIEDFFIVFFFEKGLSAQSAAAEVARYIRHYEPSEWTIDGNPVRDRVKLARRWEPCKPTRSNLPDEARDYLKVAYLKARAANLPERSLLWDGSISSAVFSTIGGVSRLALRLSQPAAALLDKIALQYGYEVTYQITQAR